MVPVSSCHSIIVLLSPQGSSCMDVRRKQKKEGCLKGSVRFKRNACWIVGQRRKPQRKTSSLKLCQRQNGEGGLLPTMYYSPKLTIHQTCPLHMSRWARVQVCRVEKVGWIWTSQLSQVVFFPFSHNYFLHFLCVHASATLWMLWGKTALNTGWSIY